MMITMRETNLGTKATHKGVRELREWQRNGTRAIPEDCPTSGFPAICISQFELRFTNSPEHLDW